MAKFWRQLLLLAAVLALSSGLDMDRSLSMKEKTQLLQNSDLWTVNKDSPPVPAWPEQFNSQFNVYVEEYGPQWSSKGILYYDWKIKTFRSDYLKWCIPLFDTGSSNYNNYTCSFLATNGSMYFVNHTSEKWEDMDCCLFEKGLAAIPPDWMGTCQYNGTGKINGMLCDVWWFPGTNDPEKPCYAYWNEVGKNTPIQFFGLTSVNRTILEYFDFKPGKNPPDIEMNKPNKQCEKACNPPLVEAVQKSTTQHKNSHNIMWWPDWPSCE